MTVRKKTTESRRTAYTRVLNVSRDLKNRVDAELAHTPTEASHYSLLSEMSNILKANDAVMLEYIQSLPLPLDADHPLGVA
jgi:hypothetical protein